MPPEMIKEMMARGMPPPEMFARMAQQMGNAHRQKPKHDKWKKPQHDKWKKPKHDKWMKLSHVRESRCFVHGLIDGIKAINPQNVRESFQPQECRRRHSEMMARMMSSGPQILKYFRTLLSQGCQRCPPR